VRCWDGAPVHLQRSRFRRVDARLNALALHASARGLPRAVGSVGALERCSSSPDDAPARVLGARGAFRTNRRLAWAACSRAKKASAARRAVSGQWLRYVGDGVVSDASRRRSAARCARTRSRATERAEIDAQAAAPPP
jgi:hypothetical protein